MACVTNVQARVLNGLWFGKDLMTVNIESGVMPGVGHVRHKTIMSLVGRGLIRPSKTKPDPNLWYWDITSTGVDALREYDFAVLGGAVELSLV